MHAAGLKTAKELETALVTRLTDPDSEDAIEMESPAAHNPAKTQAIRDAARSA